MFDVAVTWVIGSTSTGLGKLEDSFLDHFLSQFDRDELRRVLPAAAEYRAADGNVSAEEREAIRRLLAEAGVWERP